jgi:hypothetical protein
LLKGMNTKFIYIIVLPYQTIVFLVLVFFIFFYQHFLF